MCVLQGETQVREIAKNDMQTCVSKSTVDARTFRVALKFREMRKMEEMQPDICMKCIDTAHHPQRSSLVANARELVSAASGLSA